MQTRGLWEPHQLTELFSYNFYNAAEVYFLARTKLFPLLQFRCGDFVKSAMIHLVPTISSSNFALSAHKII